MVNRELINKEIMRQYRGNIVNYLREYFVIFIFLISSFSVFSQVTTVKYYYVDDTTLIVNMSAHYQIPVRDKPTVDLIEVERSVDTEGNFSVGFIYKGVAWLPFKDYGVLNFSTDSLHNWQSKFVFKRTKTFGKVEYVQLDVPFQIKEVWSEYVNGDKDRPAIYCSITEPYVEIKSWVDGKAFKHFLRPKGDGNNPFMFGVPKTGVFKMEVYNSKGEFDTYETTLKL